MMASVWMFMMSSSVFDSAIFSFCAKKYSMSYSSLVKYNMATVRI